MTAAPSLAPGSTLPISVRIVPARLWVVRAITLVVVAGPLIGSLVLAALWLSAGIRGASLAALVIAYGLGTLGVTIGFHRYFAHRAFSTGPALRLAFVVLGSMSLQGSLLYWVSTHRRHHQFSDTPLDPHSPHCQGERRLDLWVGLWHGHIGWMFSPDVTNAIRFAPDIIRDRTLFAVQRRYGLWAAAGLLAPPALAALAIRDPMTLVQIFLAAGPLRLLLVHQASWAVGSISHLWGDQPFATRDHSTNNLWVAIVAFGEGLQNNHHAFPRAAYHGFRWWEPDLTGLVLRAMEAVGLIWDVNKPLARDIALRRKRPSIADQGDSAT